MDGMKKLCDMEAAEEAQHTVNARSAHRPRLLYSCGVSTLTVARKAYSRMEGLDGPLGSLAKKLSSWATPILHPLQHTWLSLLSLADGYVLTAEDAVVSVFPPVAHLFDVLDRLALLSESVPKKFDDAADQLPAMLRRAPLVGWAADELGQGWKLLASIWEIRKAGEEREIAVDTVEHPAAVGSSAGEGRRHAFAGESRGEAAPDGDKFEEAKATAKPEDEIVEEEEATAKKATDDEAEEMMRVKDPILELFDEGWCMTRH